MKRLISFLLGAAVVMTAVPFSMFESLAADTAVQGYTSSQWSYLTHFETTDNAYTEHVFTASEDGVYAIGAFSPGSSLAPSLAVSIVELKTNDKLSITLGAESTTVSELGLSASKSTASGGNAYNLQAAATSSTLASNEFAKKYILDDTSTSLASAYAVPAVGSSALGCVVVEMQSNPNNLSDFPSAPLEKIGEPGLMFTDLTRCPEGKISGALTTLETYHYLLEDYWTGNIVNIDGVTYGEYSGFHQYSWSAGADNDITSVTCKGQSNKKVYLAYDGQPLHIAQPNARAYIIGIIRSGTLWSLGISPKGIFSTPTYNDGVHNQTSRVYLRNMIARFTDTPIQNFSMWQDGIQYLDNGYIKILNTGNYSDQVWRYTYLYNKDGSEFPRTATWWYPIKNGSDTLYIGINGNNDSNPSYISFGESRVYVGHVRSGRYVEHSVSNFSPNTVIKFTANVNLGNGAIGRVQYLYADDFSVFDLTPPTAPTISLSPSSEWSTQDVTATIGGSTDEGTGVSRYEYSIDDGASWSTYNAPLTINSYCGLWARAIDGANNLSAVTKREVKIDKAAPSVRHELSPASWCKKTTISITADDNLSGVESITLPDGAKITS